MRRMVALLRGVNVGRARALPMAELRALCGELGFGDVSTYIQSGNIVFTAPAGMSAVTAGTTLEMAIGRRFGLAAPAIVRTAAEWAGYAVGSPFPEVEHDAPNLLHLVLGATPPKPGAAAALSERGDSGETVMEQGDALWVHYPQGAGRSRLTPAMFDRMMGGAATARNWNTVRRLHLLAGSEARDDEAATEPA